MGEQQPPNYVLTQRLGQGGPSTGPEQAGELLGDNLEGVRGECYIKTVGFPSLRPMGRHSVP